LRVGLRGDRAHNKQSGRSYRHERQQPHAPM
jgi:hypothetical protein